MLPNIADLNKRKPTGNPNWVKGHVANPNGRPKGGPKLALGVRRRLSGKWKTHPVDKLVTIANFIQATNPEFAGKIWIRLLDAWEAEERKAKGSMSPVAVDDSTKFNPNDTKLLEEFENYDSSTIADNKDDGVAERKAEVSLEAGPEEDLRGDTK